MALNPNSCNCHEMAAKSLFADACPAHWRRKKNGGDKHGQRKVSERVHEYVVYYSGPLQHYVADAPVH